jgi:DNA-binding CsgD family transcriptional regulator
MGAQPFSHQSLQRELAGAIRESATAADIFRTVVGRLRGACPVEGWCGLTMDPATLMMTGGVHEHGLSPDAIRRMLEIEHGEEDLNLFAHLARQPDPVGVLSEACRGELESSPRYRDVLRPCGYGHELRAVARVAGKTWGALVLMREPGSPDFSSAETEIARNISRSIAEAIRASLLVSVSSSALSTSTHAVVVLNHSNKIEAMSPGAARWMAEFEEIGPPDRSGVPQTVQALANETRKLARDPESTALATRSRVRARNGRWLTLHGTTIGASRHSIAILMEPSGGQEVASLIFDAYGLTPRENELACLVLQGFDTEQIARMLKISSYTVQDHLKSIFDKTSVSSRKQLVSKIFFNHYLPRVQGNTVTMNDSGFA